MTGPALRAVLWDMDGVIADTAQAHFLSWQAALKTRGVDFTEEDFKRHFGQRNDTIIRDTIGAEVSDRDIEAIAEIKENHFRANIVKDLRPFPGVIDLLEALYREGIESAVASSAPRENIELLLKSLKIEQYFKASVCGQEVTEGKPSPQVFLLAARKVGAAPAECVVIEDAIAGVEAAKRGGMRCVAVTNTHDARSLAKADLVVDSLEKVTVQVLRKLI